MNELEALSVIIDTAIKHARHNQKAHGRRFSVGIDEMALVTPRARSSGKLLKKSAIITEDPWASGAYVPSAEAMDLVNQFAAMDPDPDGYIARLSERATAGHALTKTIQDLQDIRKKYRRGGPEEIDAMIARDDARDEFNRVNAELAVAERSLHPLLAVKVGRPSIARVLLPKYEKDMIKTIKDGAEIFDSMIVVKDVFPGSKPEIYMNSSDYGGYLREGTNRIVVGGKTTEKTTVHELAHFMEQENPRIAQLTQAFYQKRTAGEPAEDIHVLNEREYGYPLYHNQNLPKARADRFIEPYVGIDYESDNATEILSKGMEYMLVDPVGFAKQDPEHFAFVLDIVRNPTNFGP